jgi:hypothetical protein
VNGSLAELKLLRTSVIPNARSALETIQSGYLQGRFTLLELLDVRGSVLQALLRENGDESAHPPARPLALSHCFPESTMPLGHVGGFSGLL